MPSSPSTPLNCHADTLAVQYIHPDPRTLNNHLLTFLPTTPASPSLAIGTTTHLPPTTETLTVSPRFWGTLQSVLASCAHLDPVIISQAQAYSSTAGAGLGSGAVFFPNQPPSASSAANKRRTNRRSAGPAYANDVYATGQGGGGGTAGSGAGGAAAQGGAGGAGRGGYIHVSDTRKPPDYGRIADPEDIFGSLEVDGEGRFVDGHGRWQDAGTYRIVTNDGILGLTDYVRVKLIDKLKEEEAKEKGA